jgi:iron complex outermembrane recepter protein
MRFFWPAIIGAVLLAASVGADADEAPSVRIIKLDIKPQLMADALNQWAQATGYQVIFEEDTATAKLVSSEVRGRYAPNVALTKLLEHSGLRYEYLNARTVAIKVAQPQAVPTSNTHNAEQERPSTDAQSLPKDSEKQTETPLTPPHGADVRADGKQQIAEILVTAQKRGEERLQDVPIPVTVLDTGALADGGQTRIEDYFASVPGLSYNRQGVGQQSIAIRGLATATVGNPTVSASIDDVPIGSSSYTGRGSTSYPDVDPGDLARIEVLRGPQGTLYGASSIGGLLKFVTVDASTSGYAGTARLTTSQIEQGSTGWGVNGSLNVPLSDDLAVRASLFRRRDPGYVDNIRTGQSDVDVTERRGAHVGALWRMSDAVSLKLNGFYQRDSSDGTPEVDQVLGGLRQGSLPHSQWFNNNNQLYSAVLTADLGAIDLTSVSGYSKSVSRDVLDYSTYVASLGTDPGATGGTEPEFYQTRRITQELRLTSVKGDRIDWLAGLFFDDERSPSFSRLAANDGITGAEVDDIENYDILATLREYAVFGDMTVHFTDRFDVQIGGRESKIRQSYEEEDTGVYPASAPSTTTDSSAFTYLVTPQLHLSRDWMLYARLASGYRVGGSNVIGYGPGANSFPNSFGPDKAYNYELGSKGTMLDGLLSFDASIYYIDWKNVQVLIRNQGIFYRDNVGSAKSQGAEFSAQLHPARGLTLGWALGLTDAVLTSDFPPGSATGKSGDRLPFSSRISGSLSAGQTFRITSRAEGSVGAILNYVGGRYGEFPRGFNERLYFPAYATLNLTSGVRFNSWSVELYLNNTTNRRGVTGGGPAGSTEGNGIFYVQPRTAGLSIEKTF